MSKYKMGYLIEYKKKYISKKSGNNDSWKRKALCSNEMLSEMLKNWNIIIYSAHLVNIQEYELNHPEEKLEKLDL